MSTKWTVHYFFCMNRLTNTRGAFIINQIAESTITMEKEEIPHHIQMQNHMAGAFKVHLLATFTWGNLSVKEKFMWKQKAKEEQKPMARKKAKDNDKDPSKNLGQTTGRKITTQCRKPQNQQTTGPLKR